MTAGANLRGALMAARRWLVVELLGRSCSLVPLFLALVIGCAGYSGPQERGIPTGFRLYAETDSAELRAELASWTGRWAAATGIDVSVVEPGTKGAIPVRFASGLTSDEGLPVCALTTTYYLTPARDFYVAGLVELEENPSPGCVGAGYLLGHELAHVLAPHRPHALAGVFSDPLQHGERYSISADTLSDVCAEAPCAWMQPEEQPIPESPRANKEHRG